MRETPAVGVSGLLQVRARTLRWEAEGILAIELVPAEPGEGLPPVEAGAHIDLHLPDGLRRSYSLLNPGDTARYWIAVNRDAASRGGSRWMHEQLRCGQSITIGAPRNQFALHESAAHTVLIAGGIGITPLLAMARRLSALGKPWMLHHAVRSRAHMPFADTLRELAAGGHGQVHWHVDAEAGRVLDVAAIVAAMPGGTHVYACGPQPMLAAFEAATAALPRERVHLEYFAARDVPATGGGFVVKLHRSGRQVPVAPGQTILAALQSAGLDPLYSCGEGICGTCQVAVIAGVPDHRDLVQSDAEKAANTHVMICCSGARTPELELDL